MILGVICVGVLSVPVFAQSESDEIPSWIKVIAGAWWNDEIDDATFSDAMEFLIETNIIHIDNPFRMSQEEESVQLLTANEYSQELNDRISELEKTNLELELRLEEYGTVENREWFRQQVEDFQEKYKEEYKKRTDLEESYNLIQKNYNSLKKTFDELNK